MFEDCPLSPKSPIKNSVSLTNRFASLVTLMLMLMLFVLMVSFRTLWNNSELDKESQDEAEKVATQEEINQELKQDEQLPVKTEIEPEEELEVTMELDTPVAFLCFSLLISIFD